MSDDPLRYFRVEAAELLEGLEQGAIALERGLGDADLVRRLLRHAHTLKGAARVVRLDAVGDLSHAIETALAPWRDAPAATASVAELLRLIDAARAAIPPAADAAPPRPVAAQQETMATPPVVSANSVRVSLAEIDALREQLSAVAGTAAAVHAELEALTAARAQPSGGAGPHPLSGPERVARGERWMRARLEELRHEIAGARYAADAIRLARLAVLVPDLTRAARDAAQALGRDVRIATRGLDLRVDAHVLAALREALLHAVRNAVAHGVEAPATRLAAGKPATGTVTIEAAREHQRVVVRCSDDGAGLDTRAIRRALVADGRLTAVAAEALDDDALVAQLAGSGLSTAERLSHVAGRGVGLDVVRACAERIGGRMSLTSQRGVGTTVTLSGPLTISAVRVLAVEEAGATWLIPLTAVREVRPLEPSGLIQAADRVRVDVGTETVPLVRLARAFGGDAQGAEGARELIVLAVGAQTLAVSVEHTAGVHEVLVAPLPPAALAPPLALGVSVGPDGAPVVVLAPEALIARLARLPERAPALEPPRPPPVLIVDDSLTTRMLEQGILEAAGYEVEMAVSGEEGLERLRRRRYGLAVVDVEMPGMNGFELVATVRADEALRDIPIVMVTSRGDAVDVERGKRAGADAYIVKSEFHQGVLLDAVARLIRV